MKMKAIIFVSILCSNIMRIALYRPQPGEFLGRYPIMEEPTRFRSSFGRSLSTPPFLFSDSSRSDDFIVQPNRELEQLRSRVEMIDRGFTSLFNRPSSEPERRFPSLPTITLRIRGSSPPSAQIPSLPPFRRSAEPPPTSFQLASLPSFSSSNSYWNPVQCNCGLCAMRRRISSLNSNSNQNSGLLPRSNTAPISREEIPAPSNESINPSAESSIEPNQTNNSPDNQSNGSESATDPPPTAPSTPNGSASSPPVESNQPENPSTKPDPPEDISKKEDENPSKNESGDSKTPESTSQSESSDKSSKKKPGDPDWEGPTTPEEDQPEYYSTEENVKFVRAFTSDMTMLGKYKVAQTIYYLLTQKGHELDEADRAAISYVINERLKTDPEIKEALKKYNEKRKGENKTGPSSNNRPPSNGEMPSYMPEMLSSPNYSSEFPTTFRNENNPNSNSNLGQRPTSRINQPPSPPRFQVPQSNRRIFQESGRDPPAFIFSYQTPQSTQSPSVPSYPSPRIDSSYSPYSANIRRIFGENDEDRPRFNPSLQISRPAQLTTGPSRRWPALRFSTD